MGNYLQITKGKYHLRKAHSKLVGSWITEIGDVNEALHLWEYGKYIYTRVMNNHNELIFCGFFHFSRSEMLFLLEKH